jgi:hypothetical protein
VIQYRRLAALLLGVWLGASVLTDVAVTQNFQTVDRFLDAPGNPGTSAELSAIGRARERGILRRNAGEENNWIFLNWERLELLLGAGLLLLLLAEGSHGKVMPVLSVALLALVVTEHFLLTPEITRLGRIVDDLPATASEYKRFWMLHGFYSSLDILKILLELGLAYLTIRREPPRELPAPQNAAAQAGKAPVEGSLTRG